MNTVNQKITPSLLSGLTSFGTGPTNGFPLVNNAVHEFISVPTGSAVVLPQAKIPSEVSIYNADTNTLTVFPPVFWRCLKTPNAYVEIVKWNGKVRDWTSLKKLSGAKYGVKDGDLVEATIVGNVIKGYVNGVEVISVTDDTFKEGKPGIGFNYGVGETTGDFGFTSYEVETYDD
jgi:hypothetical protein